MKSRFVSYTRAKWSAESESRERGGLQDTGVGGHLRVCNDLRPQDTPGDPSKNCVNCATSSAKRAPDPQYGVWCCKTEAITACASNHFV